MLTKGILKRLLCAFLLCITLGSCGSDNRTSVIPQVLRIGVLPDEGKDKLKERYSPLFSYLESQFGIRCELIIPESYSALLQAFADQSIDMAYLGGVTYLKAKAKYNVQPLVMRDSDLRFTSYFLVRSSDPGERISDFEGRALSFGSELSTSGHLMPRYFLKQQGIIPENFFSRVEYSGKHDLTAFHVRDGTVDIGVANAVIVDRMFADGRLLSSDVRIIYQTPPYANYIWVMREGFNKQVYTDIQAAFLSLSPADDEHFRILQAMDAGGFLPASQSDFLELESIFNQLGFGG